MTLFSTFWRPPAAHAEPAVVSALSSYIKLDLFFFYHKLKEFFFFKCVNLEAHEKTHGTLQVLNRGTTFPVQTSSTFYCTLVLPLNQSTMLQPAVMNVKRGDSHLFLLRRGGGGWEPVRRADGISVCLICLKNTTGKAPSQTSQLHSLGWSQTFHSYFPLWRHKGLILSLNHIIGQCVVRFLQDLAYSPSCSPLLSFLQLML